MHWILFVLILFCAMPLKAFNHECSQGVRLNLTTGIYPKDKHGLITCKHKSTGKITYRFSLKEGRYHGVYRAYYQDTGKLRAELPYKHGKRHGVKKTYDRKKAFLSSEIPYVEDEILGVEKSYYPDGRVKRLTRYHPQKKGSVVAYNSQGQLSSLFCRELSATPKDRLWCGFEGKSPAVTLYDYRGRTKALRHYKDGKRHGRQEFYHENGKLAKVRYYEMGKPKKNKESYNQAGKLSEVHDEENGVYQEFYDKGLLKRKIVYQALPKETKEKSRSNRQRERKKELHYYQNGQKKLEIDYINPGLATEKHYYDTGQLYKVGKVVWDRDLAKAVLKGPWKYYREDGRLELEAKYEKGKAVEKTFYNELGELETTKTYYPDGSIKGEKVQRTPVAY